MRKVVISYLNQGSDPLRALEVQSIVNEAPEDCVRLAHFAITDCHDDCSPTIVFMMLGGN